MTYPNAVFSVFAFTGFLMCSIPFPWHLEAWNTGTCLYMAWTGLACLVQFINSVVWHGNAINWAPIWCDISTKIIIGTSFGIPAASLCINRRLYHIASVKSVTITRAEKRRGVIIDLSIGVGLPVLGMIFHYIAQGHRFNIFEDVGCWPFTYNTWVAYLLVFCPPVAIGIVSAIYAVLSIVYFNKSRSQFNELLSSHNNLTSSRYVRLMCLAGIEVLCTVPLGCYAISLNVHAGIRPWISWADTHAGFARVDQIPAMIWRTNPVLESSLQLSRWLCVVCAFIFFGFFGFADEAKKNYRSVFQTVAKRVGISTGTVTGSSGVLSSVGVKSKTGGRVRPVAPVDVHAEFFRRPDSCGSFSDISVSVHDVDEKKYNEKIEVFSPTLSYGGITLSDVGGTLADYNDADYSPTPSSGSSSASSISTPSPALTRQSSFAPPSPVSPPSPSLPASTLPNPTSEKSNTHDIV
ncbi:hypothetical protein M413DRAFT_445228 [Hebeloma cylindrosporum]|uniref:Uncharacterized protein n=1 Tax=Hebeloma cylindrosporum TaxID=76867 RepID=A0A0C3CEJ3_HEBCY|nr:hypothetical protein M413DRAFT_445228 [Hebeloma cylindrosporum h7]